jgi:hypothetical protein
MPSPRSSPTWWKAASRCRCRVAGSGARRRRGSARIYSIHTPGLRALRDWIEGFWDEALDNFKTYAEKQE